MSEPDSQQSGVRGQFGPRAAAYLHSAVHANGPEFSALRAAAEALPAARVLDLGCGAGHVGYQVAPFAAEVVAYDLAPEMLALVADRARELGIDNLRTLCGAVESLPLPDASFDLVLSRYSAHHWSAPARALAEARRVLRSGGECIVVDVASPGTALLDTHLQALEVLRDRSHVRDYSAAEWLALTAAAGLRPRRQEFARLRLEFSSWVERMATPEPLCAALRLFQASACREVRDYFEIAPDGSFSVDVMTLAMAV